MTPEALATSARGSSAHEVTLIDLLDRLLHGGIVIQGDVTLTAADIDLVKLDLRVLVAAIDTAVSR